MLHDSLSKTILRAILEGGVFGRENAGWTTSKSGHPCLCQNCSRWPPVEQTGRGSLPNHPACSPYNPIGQGTELNWTFSIVVLRAAACSVSCLECARVTWTASGCDFYQRHHICSNLWDNVQVFLFFVFLWVLQYAPLHLNHDFKLFFYTILEPQRCFCTLKINGSLVEVWVNLLSCTKQIVNQVNLIARHQHGS